MSYRTIKEYASDEFVEKRSRFIGYVKPVTTEEEAIAFVNGIKAKHWDASHNVYAYSLREGQIKRYNDDGEPQGTAGVPVLEVLTKGNIVDAVVVVTRYFGGVLLGGGGLIRAYGHGASIAVSAGEVITMSECKTIRLEMEYGLYGKVSYILPQYNIQTISSDFGASVTMDLLIRSDRFAAFDKELTELTSGAVFCQELGESYECME